MNLHAQPEWGRRVSWPRGLGYAARTHPEPWCPGRKEEKTEQWRTVPREALGGVDSLGHQMNQAANGGEGFTKSQSVPGKSLKPVGGERAPNLSQEPRNYQEAVVLHRSLHAQRGLEHTEGSGALNPHPMTKTQEEAKSKKKKTETSSSQADVL